MSTVPEVIVPALRYESAGYSCVTNMAAGMEIRPLTHEESAGNRREGQDAICRPAARGPTQDGRIAP